MSTTNIQYDSSSPYYTTSFSANGQYLGLWNFRAIPASKNDLVITISSAYHLRPDLLAHDMFGDARLWWIFAIRNPNTLASDPLGNFTQGTQIIVPDAAALKSALSIS